MIITLMFLYKLYIKRKATPYFATFSFLVEGTDGDFCLQH